MRKTLLLVVFMAMGLYQLWAQQKTITGKVSDFNSVPLSGASVMVKGTNVGVTTNELGVFTLNVPTGGKTIVISSVGFVTVELPVSSSSFNVILKSGSADLQEIVVFGYGTQKRATLSGNVASVSGKALVDKPIQTFDQALAGRAAGVQVTTANGVLNSPPVFRVRGTNSISLSSYPLIVVDGIPSFTGDYSQTASAGNALASINPDDIESIDIAKDAAASALYGSRAANGVVFVTTKKGKIGRPKVGYSGWVSWAQPFRLPELLDASEYLTFKNQAVANHPVPPAITYKAVMDADGNMVDNQWSDYVYRTGFSHSHTVNVSGGSEATNYYFAAGYTDQEGILQKNDFKRINTLFNINSRINKVLSLGGKLSYSNEQNLAANSSGSISGSAFSTAGLGRLSFVLPPILPAFNNDGSYNLNGAAIGSSAGITGISSLGYYNPKAVLDLNRSNSENNRFQSNVFVQLKPLDGLTIKSTYGIDYLLVDNDLFWSPVAGDGYSYGGYAWAAASKYKTWVWSSFAQYTKTLFEDHNIDVLIGNEQTRSTSSGYGLNRQTLSDPDYTVIQAGFTSDFNANLFMGENYLLSNFGRLAYNYKSKYFIAGNIRQDEYSALGEKKGVFWGVSGIWDVAKEGFWQSSDVNDVVNTFKIRGSYGKVGNIAGIGDYSPYSLFSSGIYGGAATLRFSSVGNDKLKWETSTKLDVGIQLGLFSDRIGLEATYYKNNIDGLILAVQQAPSTGLPNSPNENVGSMVNNGWEFALNTTPINNKNFQWTSSFNFTYNKNEVKSLAPGIPFITTSTSGLETASRTEPGYSLGQIWVVKTGGVDPETGTRVFISKDGKPVYYRFFVPTGSGMFNYSTTADGKTKFVSSTGATAISQANDAVLYANSVPKYYGGWDNTFRYKGLELNVMLTYQGGFYIYYGSNAGLHDQRWWNNGSDVLTDAWKTKGETGKKYALPVYGDNVSNGSSMPLDINVFKGDFIKLRNATLGYNIPAKLLSDAKISSLRLYVSGQNLYILTKYPGPDPEVSSNGNSNTSQGIDRNTSANARTFLVGLNIGF